MRKGIERQRNSVFISYAHKDRDWKTRLLDNMPRTVSIWDDAQIDPGDEWRGKIDEALHSAKAAVLLLSPAFLKSEYIRDNELPFILRAREEQGMTVLWLLVSECDFGRSMVENIQALTDPAEPLDGLSEENANLVLEDAARKIEASVRGRRVLVAGSTDPDSPSFQEFRKICKKLGKSLAQQRYTIVVGSHRWKTADRHVLVGANKAGMRSVEVIRVGTKLGFEREEDPKFGNLEELKLFMASDGLEARPAQVSNADVVVVMGGGTGTADVAYEAAWQHRPVIPVVALAGTAAQWWKPYKRSLLRLDVPESMVNAIRGDFKEDAVMNLVQYLTSRPYTAP